jgi:hypothetical protein
MSYLEIQLLYGVSGATSRPDAGGALLPSKCPEKSVFNPFSSGKKQFNTPYFSKCNPHDGINIYI